MSQFQADQVSDKARKFLEDLDARVKDRDVQKIFELRESRFAELQTAEEVPKPDAAVKKVGLGADSLTMLLYKELHTRHIHSTKKPEEIRIEDRVEAWNNYLALFDQVLKGSEQGEAEFDLPNGWLYDIVDEFVYQLQVYCRYRAERRGSKKDSAEEAEKLREIQKHPDIWEPVTVIRYLQRLVSSSDIIQVLLNIKQGKCTAADVLSSGPMHVQRVWGYFAMVGLLRVHTLMGDYYQALKSVEHIDFTPEKEGEKIFKKVQACHITILYYAGFAYMMMHRHYDAVRILIQALRSRSLDEPQTTNQTQSNIAKMRENCARLLAMALELAGRSPQKLGDESFEQLLNQRIRAEDMLMLRQGSEDSIGTYRSLFMQACPRFFLPSGALDHPEFSDAGKNEALNQQLNPFLREVRQQLRLPILRGYLKLYSTITLDKLARTSRDTPIGPTETQAQEAERRVDKEAERAALTRELLCLKHKTRQMAWAGGGSPLAGTLRCLADVDLYFDKDVVHIDADFSRPQAGAAYFVRHIETLRTNTKGLNPHDIFKKRHFA